MAQRTVCLCDGKYIGIETIYTVIDGKQINIPEKLKELRRKSRNNELFCPCGCGSQLILVAGDRNLKEQHFRLKDGTFNQDCNVITEGKVSIDSKIVLKCWLDDKLKINDIETRVQVQAVGDNNRKYEFSFLSKEKKIALSYCHERVNLSDEKLDILEKNSQGIKIIYVVDIENEGSDGQYPEGLMKVQNKQGNCLLLDVSEADYSKAKMRAVFYVKDTDGFWREVVIAKGQLREFFVDDSGCVLFNNETLDSLKTKAVLTFSQEIRKETLKKQERQRLQEEAEKERQRQIAEVKKRKAELEEKHRIEEKRRQEEKCRREIDFKQNMESNFSQQETQIRDAEGNRWIKCDFCGKIAKECEFTSYGGAGHINLGTCKECSHNNPAVKQKAEEKVNKFRMNYDHNVCPECGGKLREKSGQYGKFIGCSNYPECRYTRRVRNG